MPPFVHYTTVALANFFRPVMPPLQQQGGIGGFFSTSNAAIHTQIQQGGICGFFLPVMPPFVHSTTGRHLRIIFYQ
jgi:hypothetical protein